MRQDSKIYVELDTSKLKISVAVAEAGRDGDVRFIGEIVSAPDAVERLITKLAKRHRDLAFCYEAGPTGYGLHRQITRLGHDCIVVAPSLIPKRPGERVKTNRRDALTLAKLHRAGELTAVWVPDPEHEAVRASDDSCLLKPFPRSLLEVRVHARIRWLVPLNTPTSRPAEALSGFRVLFQHCCLCGADTPDPPQRSNAELKRMTIRP